MPRPEQLDVVGGHALGARGRLTPSRPKRQTLATWVSIQ